MGMEVALRSVRLVAEDRCGRKGRPTDYACGSSWHEEGRGARGSEREYGSFYRSVPLPEGVNLAEVKATFADGVLEVSVPLPSATQAKVTKVPVEEPAVSRQ